MQLSEGSSSSFSVCVQLPVHFEPSVCNCLKKVPLHFQNVCNCLKEVPVHFQNVCNCLKEVPVHFQCVQLSEGGPCSFSECVQLSEGGSSSFSSVCSAAQTSRGVSDVHGGTVSLPDDVQCNLSAGVPVPHLIPPLHVWGGKRVCLEPPERPAASAGPALLHP